MERTGDGLIQKKRVSLQEKRRKQPVSSGGFLSDPGDHGSLSSSSGGGVKENSLLKPKDFSLSARLPCKKRRKEEFCPGECGGRGGRPARLLGARPGGNREGPHSLQRRQQKLRIGAAGGKSAVTSKFRKNKNKSDTKSQQLPGNQAAVSRSEEKTRTVHAQRGKGGLREKILVPENL